MGVFNMPVRKHSLPGNICWLQKWCDWFISFVYGTHQLDNQGGLIEISILMKEHHTQNKTTILLFQKFIIFDH